MKKLSKIIAAVTAVCTLALGFTLAGCAKKDNLDLGDGTGDYIAKKTDTEVVFVGTTEVLKEHDEYSVYDYLRALSLKNQLTFDGYTDDYGYYVTTVNGVTADTAAHYYWAFYISFQTLEGDDAIYAGGDYMTEYDYEGATLYSANYGVSGVPYVSGATYALVLETW